MGNHGDAERLLREAEEAYDVLRGRLSLGNVGITFAIAGHRIATGDIDGAVRICLDREVEVEDLIAANRDQLYEPAPAHMRRIDRLRSVHMNVLNLFLGLNQYDRAIAQAGKIYRYDRNQTPRSDDNLSNSAWRLAEALRRREKGEEAVGYFHEAIAIEDRLANIKLRAHNAWRYLNDLAEALFDLGRLDEADAALLRSIPLCSSKAVIAERHEFRSRILAAKGDRNGAFAAVLEAKAILYQIEDRWRKMPGWMEIDRRIQSRLQLISRPDA